MLESLDRHKYGILITIIFHLLMVVVFYAIKVNNLSKKTEINIPIEVASEEDIQAVRLLEAMKQQGEALNSQLGENISSNQGRNIPVNVSDKFKDEISTEKYEEEVKHEIKYDEEWNPEAYTEEHENQLKEDAENFLNELKKKQNTHKVSFKGKTNIYYDLQGRSHTYLPVPVYQCEGGGTVVVSIEVSPEGRVVNAVVSHISANSTDDCYSEAARSFALRSQFEEAPAGKGNQKGTLTYEFIAQ
jgi:TonB family protein